MYIKTRYSLVYYKIWNRYNVVQRPEVKKYFALISMFLAVSIYNKRQLNLIM